MLPHFTLLNHLLLIMNLLISGVHLNITLNLTSGDTLPIAISNNIIKAQYQVKGLLGHDPLIHLLGLALTNDNLLHLPYDL